MEIVKVGDNSYTIMAPDHRHQCGLTKDEALGTLASWLYTGDLQFRLYYDDEPHTCFATDWRGIEHGAKPS